MTIKREINGSTVEIELSAEELFEAFQEQEDAFRIQFIENWIDRQDDEVIEDEYGQTKDELKQEIPSIAADLKEYLYYNDVSWESAVEYVIEGYGVY